MSADPLLAGQPGGAAAPAGKPGGEKFLSLTVSAHPVDTPALRLQLGDQAQSLDLEPTAYGIRVRLKRNADSSVEAVIHRGASVRVQAPDNKSWKVYSAGERVPLEAGVILFDERGKLTARVEVTVL